MLAFTQPMHDYPFLLYVSLEQVTKWLDQTELLAREYGLDNELLDDTWYELRAENDAKFEARMSLV